MKPKLSRQQFIQRCTTAAGGMLLPWSLATENSSASGRLADTSASTSALPYIYGSPDTPDPDELPGPPANRWRGSWVQQQEPAPGDLLLAGEGQGCQLVVSPRAASAVQQAARFLAADLQKISGYRPPIVPEPIAGLVNIHLATLGTDEIPANITLPGWDKQPEAFRIVTIDGVLWLVGSDFRGTAFAAYTLAERLGIDPLYWWTGYEPEQHTRLVMKATDYRAAPPAFRYRGFFHDDEDILQRPFEATGYPLRFGDISLEWYQRYFETALRLGMNMVAPYTRAHRREEVQRCASDWGLYYTSHHYDILLSNPFGIQRFNLAEKRKVDPTWDWFSNRKGMTDYWKGGVEENKKLNTIWPVGLRGTDDHAYAFPSGMTPATQAKTFREVLDTQVQLVEQALPKDHHPLFHFTLYTEMLEQYLHNRDAFDIPENVIIVWPDDNNGLMRQLPTDRGKWRHGVYYHLAYFGGQQSKQTFHTVSPVRIAEEFEKILDAGTTEFMLVNTSELREFVMEARMIARLSWEGRALYSAGPEADRPASPETARSTISTVDGSAASHVPAGSTVTLSPIRSASAYTRWWANEYFGPQQATAVTALYQSYYDFLDDAPATWFGTDRIQETLDLLYKKCTRQPYDPLPPASLKEWASTHAQYESAVSSAEKLATVLDRKAAQFLFEQVVLGLLCNACTLEAALLLARSLTASDERTTWAFIMAALKPLERLELAILRAERPPFEKWYRETWIRTTDSPLNLHRPYNQLQAFITAEGKVSPVRPPVKLGHNIPQAQKWTRFLEETPEK